MLRKIARMTAVIATLGALSATSAMALDDNKEGKTSSPGPPVSIDSGVYGYDSTTGSYIVWDLYLLPNGQKQRLCHPAGKSSPKTGC